MEGWNNGILSWGCVIAGTPLVLLTSLRVPGRWFQPIASAVVIFIGFAMELQYSVVRAFGILISWTLWQSVLVWWLAYYRQEKAQRIIWRAEEYTDSMFRWVETSRLPEGPPASVIVFHLKQSVLYCVAALASGNFLSLVLGSALLNYMNYYVAQLASRSAKPSLALILGWNPWSIVRVISFLWLGLVLSLPVLSRFIPVAGEFSWNLMLPGLVGIGADVALKIVAGVRWSRMLKQNLK